MVSEAIIDGCRIIPACRALSISDQTFRRWRDSPEQGDERQGPKTQPANKLSQYERKKVIEIATSEKYRDHSPDKIVPMLADEGIYLASESTFYRIMREEKMLVHRSDVSPKSRHRPEPLVATGPNQVYSWDITYLRTPILGIFLYLYLVLDIYSRKIVGWRIHENESSENAADLIENICIKEGINAKQLSLHSDNGSPMKGATMLATLQRLGVIPSFSRPSVSNDNPFPESIFRTLKYCPQYPSDCFGGPKQAIAWMIDFERWYNHEHLHSGIKFVTPESRHQCLDNEILRKRKLVYEKAKQGRPNRWSRGTRNWEPITLVKLNPKIESDLADMKWAA